MSSPQTIGDRMRSLRSAAGISQRSLADRIGVSQATIARWEAGQLDNCFDELNRVAEAFGITCCELVGCEP